MVVMVFRSRLRADAGSTYTEWAGRMEALARQQPGFRSFKTFRAEDGERLSFAEFDDDAAVRAWGAHTEHREAQRLGRERFYESYDLQIAEVIRDSRFAAEGR